MKKISIVLLGLCFVLCGCGGYREIDRGYFVTAIAIFTQNDTTTMLVEALSSSDVLEQENKKVVLCGCGDNTNQAFQNLKKTVVKPLYFEHIGVATFDKTTDEYISFLKEIPDISYGIYIVKTDDAKRLLESESPNGVVGYDTVALIKNAEKEQDKNFYNRLYNIKNDKELPTVNFDGKKLTLEMTGE